MIHVLKITAKMWGHIESGTKKVEVRKLNKDHINVGDVILYVNLRLDTIYGKRLVYDKTRVTREQVVLTESISMDEHTRQFVKDNYNRIKELLVFNIEGVNTWLDYQAF